eukprot:TRINITY_DN1254_c0_g1_i1.p1 TRINITY_DN1254_c0_g1~~TRINITY_DN1254_c0_g1_i1.p1  ORF type:complete len:1404 (+),score=288.29 TRINITY_DN1254_c0_g1_i1:40-4251(+)
MGQAHSATVVPVVIPLHIAQKRFSPVELEQLRSEFDAHACVPGEQQQPGAAGQQQQQRAAPPAPRATTAASAVATTTPVTYNSIAYSCAPLPASIPVQPTPVVKELPRLDFVLHFLGVNVPSILLKGILRYADPQGRGFITWQRFLSACAIFKKATNDEKLQFLTIVYDLNGTQQLTRNDLQRLLVSLHSTTELVHKKLSAITALVQDCFVTVKEFLNEGATPDAAPASSEKPLSDEETLPCALMVQWAEASKDPDAHALVSWLAAPSDEGVQKQEDPGTLADAESSAVVASRRKLLRSSFFTKPVVTNTNIALQELLNFSSKTLQDLFAIYEQLRFSPAATVESSVEKETVRKIMRPFVRLELLEYALCAYSAPPAGDGQLADEVLLRDFICGLSTLCKGTVDEKLQCWFEIYDTDKDGRLGMPDLSALLSAVWTMQLLHQQLRASVNFGEDDEEADTVTSAVNINEKQRTAVAAHVEDLCKSAFTAAGIGGEGNVKISLYQYEAWLKENPTTKQLLERLPKLSSVFMGVKPDSAAEEKGLIRQLLARMHRPSQQRTLREGSVYYVLSSTWWNAWKEYAHYDSEEPISDSEVEDAPTDGPGPIDNRALVIASADTLEVSEYTLPLLQANLVEGSDFVFVDASVWGTLYGWYGGSPVVPRKVIREGDQKTTTIELYPYTIQVYLHRANSVTYNLSVLKGSEKERPQLCTLTVSRKEKMANIERYCFRYFRLFADAKVRLWVCDRKTGQHDLVDDTTKSVEESLVTDGQLFALEVARADGTWPVTTTASVHAVDTLKKQTQQLLPLQLRKQSRIRGVIGLTNLGNTCFMNATLQCLSNTWLLTEFFANRKHEQDLNTTNPLGHHGDVAQQYASVVSKLWSGGRLTSCFSPSSFKKTLARYAQQFAGNQQHDAHELLIFLLDALHEDLNRVKKKPYTEAVDAEGKSDEELANLSWDTYKLRNQSVVVDLCQGQTRSVLTCPTCGYASVTFEPFSCLSLPLPIEQDRLLEVVLFYSHGQLTTKYGVIVPQDGTVADVKVQLCKLCGLQPAQIVLADVGKCYFCAFLGNHKSLRTVTGTVVYAYEVTAPTYVPRAAVPLQEDIRPPQPQPPQSRTPMQWISGFLRRGTRGNGAPQTPSSNVGTACDPKPPKSASPKSPTITRPETLEAAGPKTTSSQHVATKLEAPKAEPPPQTVNSMAATEALEAVTDPVIHIHFIHRLKSQREVWLLAPQRAQLFGRPIIVSLRLSELSYASIQRQLWLQIQPCTSSKAACSDHKVPSDQATSSSSVLPAALPYSLSVTNRTGTACGLCTWSCLCLGCRLDEAHMHDVPWDTVQATIAVDWDQSFAVNQYDATKASAFLTHKSVTVCNASITRNMTLQQCLNRMIEEEKLDKDSTWYCPRYSAQA